VDVILGFGPLHDRLLAAALRGCGLDARAADARAAEALSLGRALLSRGYPCTSHYLVGAMALCARQEPARALRFIVPGDRCGGYATDLARALASDRAPSSPAVSVLALSPDRAEGALWTELGSRWETAARLLIDAAAVGDVLETTSARARASGRDPRTTDARVAAAVNDAERALESGKLACEALSSRRSTLRSLRGGPAPRGRVRVTGELLPSRYDVVGAGVARWIESRGARVDTPSLCEWLLYAAWRASVRGELLRALRHVIARALARNSEAIGAPFVPPIDPTEWVVAAREWMPVSLSAGSGFLELATYLAVDRDRRADLVISLKPFASITSSAVSDAVIESLSRERRTAFLALEVNGDLSAQLESRVELALFAALAREENSR
jgi:predicted nucleotide-binding protein (sugar kinase/HSP70/actin superfamily)